MAEITRVTKPWGEEVHWAITSKYVGTILRINAGCRLSLQYHERKEESIFVLSGLLRLHLADSDGVIGVRELQPGQAAHVPVGRAHRFEAVRPTELIEVSTPELDDVIRLADDYGREGTSAP